MKIYPKVFDRERDKIYAAEDYIRNYNDKFFNLQINMAFVNSFHPQAKYYDKKDRAYGWYVNDARDYGTIWLNIPLNINRSYEDICHTMRHELAHAYCHLRLGYNGHHGPTWRRIAKIMRVKTECYKNHRDNDK